MRSNILQLQRIFKPILHIARACRSGLVVPEINPVNLMSLCRLRRVYRVTMVPNTTPFYGMVKRSDYDA